MTERTLTHNQYEEDDYRSMREKGEYLDVKLASAGNPTAFVLGHRVVIGAISTVIKKLMTKATNKEEPILLKNIEHSMLSLIVQFIYEGRLIIPEEKYEDFGNSYRMLNIKLGGKIDKEMYGFDDEDDDDDDNDETILSSPEKNTEKVTNNDIQKATISSNTEGTPPILGFGLPRDIKQETHEVQKHQFQKRGEQNSAFSDHLQPKWHQSSPPQNQLHNLQHQTQKWKTQQLCGSQSPETQQEDEEADPGGLGGPTCSMRMRPEEMALFDRMYLPPEERPPTEGAGGHWWIKVQNVTTDDMKEIVRDSCQKFGEVKEFVEDSKSPHSFFVGFQSEEVARKVATVLPISQKQLKVEYPTELPQYLSCVSNIEAPITDDKSALINITAKIPPPAPIIDDNSGIKLAKHVKTEPRGEFPPAILYKNYVKRRSITSPLETEETYPTAKHSPSEMSTTVQTYSSDKSSETAARTLDKECQIGKAISSAKSILSANSNMSKTYGASAGSVLEPEKIKPPSRIAGIIPPPTELADIDLEIAFLPHDETNANLPQTVVDQQQIGNAFFSAGNVLTSRAHKHSKIYKDNTLIEPRSNSNFDTSMLHTAKMPQQMQSTSKITNNLHTATARCPSKRYSSTEIAQSEAKKPRILNASITPLNKSLITPLNKSLITPLNKASIAPINKASITPLNKADKLQVINVLRELLDPHYGSGPGQGIRTKQAFKVLLRELTHRVMENQKHQIERKDIKEAVNNIFKAKKVIENENDASFIATFFKI